MDNDENVCNRIFEMVKQKMSEKPKKKKRKRVFTEKQRAQMLKNLAKGRETLRLRREAKRKVKLDIKPVKPDPVKVEKPEPVKVEKPEPVKVREPVKVVKPEPVNEVVKRKPVQHKRVVPSMRPRVADAEVYHIDFTSGGSFW